MKFECRIKPLKAALSMVKRAISPHSGIPLLNSVRIVADEDCTVAFVGTDLEVMMATEIECHVEKEGECCVDWKTLNDTLTESPGDYMDMVSLEWIDGYIHVTEGDRQQRIPALPTVDFPMAPQIPLTQKLEIAEGIKKCLPFISDEDSRRVLQGVHINSSSAKLVFVGTDGKTMKVMKYAHTAKEEDQFSATLNKRACAAIQVKFRDLIQIGFDEDNKQLRIHDTKRELIAKLMDSMYPDFDSILEPSLSYMHDGNSVELELDRQELLDKLERMCANVLKKYMPNISIAFIMKDGVVELRYADKTSGVETQDCLTPIMSTGDLTVGFSPFLLRRALKGIDHDRISMYGTPGRKDVPGIEGECSLYAILMVPTEFEDGEEDYTVLMPMRLKEYKSNG
jgi:DNA polymerase III sliding clamp (beta) subunit (PCNA family)